MIQNSLGSNFCDNGFLKIEFGEIGIENIAFSQPYIPNESENKVIIKDLAIHNNCDVKINIEDNEKKNLDESFEIIYKNSITSSLFYYQCGILSVPITKEKQINCYYDLNQFKLLEEGTYNYVVSKGLGKMNIYLNSYSKTFIYNNENIEIENFFQSEKTYISSSQSKIILKDISKNKNFNRKIVPSLFFSNEFKEFNQNNCEYLEFLDNYYIYCNISNQELDYLNNLQIKDNSIFYNKLCGIKLSTHLKVFKIDETKYPIFYAEKLIISNKTEFNNETIFLLEGIIRGNLSEYNTKDNSFSLFVIIKKKSQKITQLLMKCYLNSIEKENVFFKANCKMAINSILKKTDCVDFEIFPFFIPNIIKEPYEVIISEEFLIQEDSSDKNNKNNSDKNNSNTNNSDTNDSDKNDKNNSDKNNSNTNNSNTNNSDTNDSDKNDSDKNNSDKNNSDTNNSNKNNNDKNNSDKNYIDINNKTIYIIVIISGILIIIIIIICICRAIKRSNKNRIEEDNKDNEDDEDDKDNEDNKKNWKNKINKEFKNSKNHIEINSGNDEDNYYPLDEYNNQLDNSL